MKNWAELLASIAMLLWPVFAFVMLWLFRSRLGNLLDRLEHGKLPGGFEFHARAADIATEKPLTSSVAIENLDALLTSPRLQDDLWKIISSASTATKEDVTKKLIQVLQYTVSAGVKNAFVKVDTRPLLGTLGKVWEEPIEADLTVQRFLDRIWSGMYPYVKGFRYSTGWVLRDPKTGRLFSDIGRNWARKQGNAEDKRLITNVGIEPGSVVEVVGGPKVTEAILRL